MLRALPLRQPVNRLFHKQISFYRQLSVPRRNMEKSQLELPVFNPAYKVNKDSDTYKPIVWIDCEMTGLDVFNDHIIEICAIVTDSDLNLVDEGYESVIHYDQSEMNQMGEWCIQHHGESGLTKKVVESDKTLQQVEKELLEYLKKFTNKKKAVLAGNSVHMDRIFMTREFPKVIDHLHYRIIDVSSIYEFSLRHNPQLARKCPKKREAHTAKADILESIAQMKWFRDNYFVGP